MQNIFTRIKNYKINYRTFIDLQLLVTHKKYSNIILFSYSVPPFMGWGKRVRVLTNCQVTFIGLLFRKFSGDPYLFNICFGD